MSSHAHLVLRSRPDVVASWSARRWLRLCPKRRNPDRSPAEPTGSELDMIRNHPKALAERRRHLSDVSWYMKCLTENIARRSNAENQVLGHFFEGRFRAQLLLGEASLLAYAAYVDLNPIRAAMAETPESSDFAGAKDRIDDCKQAGERTRQSTHDWERSRERRRSGWMSPIEIDERRDPTGPHLDDSGLRASLKGFLSISLEQYLELLDWRGRQIRSDKVGSIPEHLQPILTPIGLDTHRWCDVVIKFGRMFKRTAGSPEHRAEEASRRGQNWLCAPENPLGLSPA